jgi:hypothetical protein
MRDRIDPPWWWKPWINPAGAVSGWWHRARPVDVRHITGLQACRDLAWFRVHGYGLWVKWGRSADLYSTRQSAHYAGRLRWKMLRP